jgi:hypothetical protein
VVFSIPPSFSLFLHSVHFLFNQKQILTCEDWNMVLFNGMAQTTPWAALYFVALMTFGNYVLFNLLVAILVEGFQESKEEEKRQLVGTFWGGGEGNICQRGNCKNIFIGRGGEKKSGRGGKREEDGVGNADCQNNVAGIFATEGVQLRARQFVGCPRAVGLDFAKSQEGE